MINFCFSCSFFLDSDSCGKSRAEVATQLLLELNADVRGDYVDENIDQLLENSPDFFNNFTVVIGTSLTERLVLQSNLSRHTFHNASGAVYASCRYET